MISDAGEKGITVDEIQQQTEVSRYGIKLLIDMGLVCKLVWQKDDRYILDKVGHFIIHDKMVRVNFNFIQDVCYEGLFQLVESIKTGKPEGFFKNSAGH